MARKGHRGGRRKQTASPSTPIEKWAPVEPEAVREIIGSEVQREVQAQIVQVVESFSGPIPPPKALREYDEVVPGAAERILKMAEEQANHRQALERNVVEGGTRRADRGLWLGFVISLVVIGVGTALILLGHEVAGSSLVGGNLVTLAGVFVFGRVDQRKERLDKAKIGGFQQ